MMCLFARRLAPLKKIILAATKDHIERWSSDGDFRISDDAAGLSGIPLTLLRLSVMEPSDFPQVAKDALIEQKICTPEELNQAGPDCCSI